MSLHLLLALALVCPRQDASAHFTYRTVAVPLSKVLEDVSKATGSVLKASPSTENETIVVVVKDVTLETFKAKLATAVSGQWTKDKDGVEYLGADTAARAAEARTELQHRTEDAAKQLKDLQSVLNPKKADQQAEPDGGGPASMGQVEGDMAILAQLSLALRPAELAAIPDGGRVVYSTSPNAMQRPLNVPNLAKYFADYAVEHNKQVDMTKGSNENIDPEQAAKMEEIKKSFGISFPEPKRIDGPPAKVLLIVENGNNMGPFSNGISLSMVAFNTKGEAVASCSNSLGGGMMAATAVEAKEVSAQQETGAKQETKKVDPKLAKAIEFSPLSKELRSFFDFRSMGTSDRKASPELLEHILRPDLYDPLSYEYSESLMALVDAEELNLVADVPDVSVDTGSMVSSGQESNLASFKSGLESGPEIDYQEKDGWASLKAKYPSSARSKKVDRKSLAKLLNSANKTIVPTLDALSDYASVNPPIMETPVVILSVMLVAPNAVSTGMRGFQDWPMLRLYGLLGPSERATLRQGQVLPFSNVGPKALPIIKQMVYGAGGKFQVGPDPEAVSLGWMSMASAFMPKVVSSYKDEPTELLPNGLPSQGGLSLALKPGHFVMADTKGFMATMFGAMGPEEFAMLKYFTEDPKMSAMSGIMPKLDKFRIGERDQLDVRLHLAADVTQKHTLMDHRIAKDSAVVGADGLPKDFMADVDKQLKLFKDGMSPFSMGTEMFGGRPPSN